MSCANKIQCPKCDLSFGQESRFLRHLTNDHQIIDHVEFYNQLYHSGVHPTCNCDVTCNEKLHFTSWKKGYISRFVRGHNARLDSVYMQPHRQREFVDTRKRKFASGELKVWNAGLTKETSSKIAASGKKASETLINAYKTGELTDWRKLDPEKAKIAAVKISKSKKDAYSNGSVKPWNVGETKLTNDSVARTAEKISQRYKTQADCGRRIKQDDLIQRINVFCDRFELASNPEEYTTRRVNRLKFACKKCGSIQVKSLAMLEETPICFSCAPKISQGESEVYEFVKSLGFVTISSDREQIAPKELDIYVPEKKFGIEYNGLYWHSSAVHANALKHVQEKRDACMSKGINLFVVYEDEWRDHRKIVEGMIRHRLGIHDERIGARKLRCRQVNQTFAKEFFNANHLEGYVACSVTLGLYDGDRLVAAMSLRRPFHKKYKDYLEVARCCTLLGTHIPGWLGKLTAEAKLWSTSNGNIGLVTYVDSRVGLGTGYRYAGWKPMPTTDSPRFWWTDYVNRYNRFRIRADSKRGISQKSAASQAGVVKIFGCRNTLWSI